MSDPAHALALVVLDAAERYPDIGQRLAAIVATHTAAPTPMLTDWITLGDIERERGISKRISRRWIQEGKLTAQKIGREYRVRRDALEALLAASRVEPVTTAHDTNDADPALTAALSKARAKTLRKVGR